MSALLLYGFNGIQRYHEVGMSHAMLIDISGESGSCKTTIVRKISEIESDFIFLPNDLLFKPIAMPQNDFIHHRRSEKTLNVDPKKLIIFKGSYNEQALNIPE